MRLKSGVVLDGVHFLLWYAAAVADVLHQRREGTEATITSARDGQHRGPWHPLGRAIDIRIHDVHDPRGYADDLAMFLPAPTFAVVLESDHIHISAPVAGETRV